MTVTYPFLVGPGSLNGRYTGNQYVTIASSPWIAQVNGQYYSMVFPVQKSANITDVGFYFIISGTNSQFLFDVVTLDTNGVPSNTNYGGSSGSVLQAGDLVAGWNWIPLSSPATGTVGDNVGARLKILNASTSNYILISGATVYDSNLPRKRNTSELVGEHPIVGVKYNDGTVQGMPLNGLTKLSYTSGSDPDEYGLKFSVPIDMSCNGARIVGVFSSNAACKVLLYNDTEVVRVANIVDEDQVNGASVSAGAAFQVHWSDYDLVADNTYRLTVLPNTVGDTVSLFEQALVTSTYSYILPGGDFWQETYRTDSGSFTDVPNNKLWMSLLVTDVTPSTGTSTTTTIISGEGASAWAY